MTGFAPLQYLLFHASSKRIFELPSAVGVCFLAAMNDLYRLCLRQSIR